MASVGDSGESLSLNIMPMLDIFSILILFLLMSFSSDPVNHDITLGLEIPVSKTFRSLDDIPKITVTKQFLYYDNKKIADIDPATDDFTFESFRGSQGALYSLFGELESLREAQIKRRSVMEADDQDLDDRSQQVESLTLEIDKSLNFIILKRVMKSAQQAEFISFKLMVEKSST